MVHQLLSHSLHPVDGVPILNLTAPIAGAYMLSPWIVLTNDPIIYTNEGHGDILGARMGLYWGRKVLNGVPESAMPYVNPLVSTPEGWLEDSNAVIKNVLISAGNAELLRGAIIQYSKSLEKHHKNVTLFIEDHGVHNDILLKFLVGDKDLGKLAPLLVDWLVQSFSS